MAVWRAMTEDEQGSIFTDPLMYQPMLASTASMSMGLYGGRHAMSATRMWMAGYSTDLSVARRVTGQSMMGKAYSGYLGRSNSRTASWLAANIPTLNQLSVGRHLTFMSGVGGELGSINMMTGLQNIEKMAGSVMQTKGLSYQESLNYLFRGSGGTNYGTMARSWQPFSRAPFMNEAARADLGWQRTMYRGYGHSAPFSWGEAMQMHSMPATGTLGEANAQFASRMASINADIMAGRNTAVDKAARRQLVRDLAAETGTNRSAIGRGATALAERAAASESIYAMIGLRAVPKMANLGSKALSQYMFFELSSLGGQMAAGAFKKMATIPGDLYRKITSDIHRGTFISSAPLSPFVGATGRQRALADIHYKQLNLSQALGNESKMLIGRR
jgi:hypothetical protein